MPPPGSSTFSCDAFSSCPRCDKSCKSRTRCLTHFEACFKGPGSVDTHSRTASSEGSAGILRAEGSATMVDHQNRRLPCSFLTEDVTSPSLLESVASASTSNALHSHAHGYKPPQSSRVTGKGGGEAVHSDLTESGENVNGEFFRHSTSNLGGHCNRRGKSMHTTPIATSRASFRRFADDLHVPGSASSLGAGGGILVNGVSRSTIPSPRNSLSLGSPHAPRASGTCHEGGAINTSAAPGHTSAPAPPPVCSSFHTFHPDKVPCDRQPSRQDSFRLPSGRSWMQYTPSASEEEGDDDAQDEHDGPSRGSFSRESPRILGSVQGSSDAAVREAGGSLCNAGAECVMTPGGVDTSPGNGVHVRQYTRGKMFRGDNSPGGASDVSLQSMTGMHQNASSTKEGGRHVPRLFSKSIDDLPPQERNVGGAADGRPSLGSGASVGRFHSSRRNSVSPMSLSQSSPLVFSTSGQAIASPNSMQASVLPTSTTASGCSVSRLSGPNLNSSGGGGVRTPRQGDHSGSVTPRALSFQRGRAVGSGGFGTVYQVILSDGSLAAVKELKLENANFKAIDREVRAMSSIPPHPNCVRYLGSRYSAHHYYIIMEYISGGSINSLRKSVGRFRESVFQRYAYMVLLGLSHLHTNGIVHRDIKGANVLLDESGCAKIVDFGCSRDLNHTTTPTTSSGCGTPLWMAPEVCRGEPTTEKSDVWSFGCLCLEMTNETGLPWSFLPSMTLHGVVYALACAKSPPPIPADLSSEAQDFLQRCLQLHPEERATVAELLQHPFFDLDLMEDSEGDELLSSCETSARQSAVKRAVRQMNRSSALDAMTHPSERRRQRCDKVGKMSGRVNNAQEGSPMPAFAGVSLSPRVGPSNSCGHTLDLDSSPVSRSSNSHSKSPSGPQLDYYTRSVNVGFKLQAVNEEEDDGGDTGEEEESVGSTVSLGGEPPPPPPPPPPAVSEVAVAEMSCHAPSNHSGVEDDENEYTQMITEMITDAREAYTDEERRMTERWRRLSVMYPSSDEDTSLTATVSNHGSRSGSDSGSSAEAVEGSYYDSIESDVSTFSGSYEDDRISGKFLSGPCNCPLGATWPAERSRSRATTESPMEQQGALNDVPQLHPASATRATDAVAPAASALSSGYVSLPRSELPSSLVPAATSPTSVQMDSTEISTSLHASSPSRTPGLSLRPQSQQPPRVALSHPTLIGSCFREQQQQPQRRRPVSPQGGESQEVVKRDFFRDASGSRRSLSFGKSPTDSLVDSAAGGGIRSPRESRGFMAVPIATRHPGGTSMPSQHTSARSATGPPLSSTSVAPHSSPRGAVLSDCRGSCQASPQPPPLVVSEPHRHICPQESASMTTPFFANAKSASRSIESYTGGTGRFDAGSATWKTGASGHQPKELSIAQREVQEMLDWRISSDRRYTSLPSSPDPGRRCINASLAVTSATARSRDSSHRRFRLRCSKRNDDKYLDSEYKVDVEGKPLAGTGSTGLSATETVFPAPRAAKRKPSGIRIFRKLNGK
ncbi:hypothetical protein JKF63_03319 [Porcisia hertigi]|uniref:Protein kinase domain-containing protein n=1 Tax=Porcisia hertigi TaxID=2761500 RepID=A0A836IRI3_9TRYP|nr:hypothetical protein JKF63_03319 [Porcisia hertigi]